MNIDTGALDRAIHKVPDFPKPGVLFYDITGILAEPPVFASVIDYYAERYRAHPPKAIAAIDSRGFIFASPIAYKLRVPLLLVRKSGKLPRKTVRASFSLEYGKDEVELNPEDVPHGPVVLFDDLLATGGTAKAASSLLEAQGASIMEIAGVIGLEFLPFAKTLEQYKIKYLVSYQTESVK